jgi:hypothetical protein
VLTWLAFLLAGFAVAYFGLPACQRHARETRAKETAAAVQQFVKAFEGFASEHGEWPAATTPGALPVGMESQLRDTPWSQTAAIGGKYVWLIDTSGVHAAISIVAPDPQRPLDARDVDELWRTLRANAFPAARLRENERHEPLFVLED